MISNAVPTELISRIVGYKITKGDFANSTPNLPQRIAIIGEANTANQSGLTNEPVQITSAQQAGELFGYGSAIHMAMRILRPVSGDGVAGIPTVVYPQITEVGATAKIYETTFVGTATKTFEMTVEVSGRENLDGASYNFTVLKDDTATTVAQKMADAINGVLGSPFSAVAALGVVTSTTKWQGETADDLYIQVFTESGSGITVASGSIQAGTGIPTTISDSLDLFGEDWNTIVINTYGLRESVLLTLQNFNGKPDPDAPTGRYSSTIMKPFIALTGSFSDEDSDETDRDIYKDDVTVAICPAPRTFAHPLEAAANMAYLFARTAQDTPHRDINGRFYPDMPVPRDGVIGPMSEYVNRDVYVKKGNSTVALIDGKYQIQDFVTTYHPTGETVPQFRYCRNLMLDFNVRFGYYLLEQINVVDKTIAENNEPVAVSGVIKPKSWKAILFTYADDLVARALIVDASFMQDSLQVGISTTNSDRLETFFRYKRTGVARISSTTAEAGFNFGTL